MKRCDDKIEEALTLDTDNETVAVISRLQQEVQRLNDENKILKEQVATLEATDKSEEEESDEEEDSVCDGSFWSQKCFLLKQYKQEHGDCKVPRSHKALGVWVNNMRSSRRKAQLSQDRIDKLDKIGFHWGKGFAEPATWNDSFRRLQEYHGNFGHCNIHVDDNPALRYDLAKWVIEQCKQGKRLRKAKACDMTTEQYKLLNGLGFTWKVVKKKTARGSKRESERPL